MDNLFCMIGAAALLVDIIIVFFTETDDGKEESRKKKNNVKFVMDTANLVFALSLIAVLAFALFGISLYANGYI